MADQHLIVAKIVAIVVLLLVTLVFCFVPYILDRFYKWTKRPENNAREFKVVLCLLNFGGGVLIATTFIHMLPEVVEVVGALQDCRMLVPTPFGLPEVLLCTGFYLMYCIEEAMHFIVRRRQQKKLQEVVVIKEVGVVVQPEETPKQPNWLRGLGIIVALSLHELFGGMAIGLEMSVSTVWFMTGAIAVHKLVLAFCIGMEIMMAHTRWLLAVVYLLVFSIVTPIGVGIGIAGLACGTLIYVVFFEIVAKNHAGLRVLLSSVVGFVLMFGLQIAIGEAKGKSHFTCP
ncbi:hypothetical protein M5D96_009858 [Drosophila gunungcola]|uniref:Zinc transporter ZIP1 n=1 Tax=Drosophila gunungcola TaxID=103775 RepID=A0A9P9YHX3_9MUSC|nr:hypothetical protein M5D96_009858 [Drosophila gunungcola]